MTNPEAPNKKTRCQFITKNGSRCHADPQTGKDWCFMHDPEQKKKQAEARRQGGEARSRQIEPELTPPPNLPSVRLEKAGDVFDLLIQHVDHLRGRKLDVRVAQAIAYLASLLLRSLKAGRPFMARLMADTINELRQGETDLRTAKAIGHLTSVMLTALKQEVEEAQAQSAMEAEPTTRPTGELHVQSPNLAGLAALAAAMAAAKPPDGPKPHPAVINGAAHANNASQPLSS
jgi:hypothetical protein